MFVKSAVRNFFTKLIILVSLSFQISPICYPDIVCVTIVSWVYNILVCRSRSDNRGWESCGSADSNNRKSCQKRGENPTRNSPGSAQWKLFQVPYRLESGWNERGEQNFQNQAKADDVTFIQQFIEMQKKSSDKVFAPVPFPDELKTWDSTLLQNRKPHPCMESPMMFHLKSLAEKLYPEGMIKAIERGNNQGNFKVSSKSKDYDE